MTRPSDCGGTTILLTWIFWIRGGISFTVVANDVDRDHVVKIVDSLFRS